MAKKDISNRFTQIIEDKVAPKLIAFSENKYIASIRDGLMATIPFTIIGGVFLIITSFPIPAWQKMITPYANMFNVVVFYTYNIIALIASLTIAYNLAKNFNIDRINSALFSMIGFLMLSLPDEKFTSIPIGFLGGSGLFGAIVISIITVEVLKFFYNKKIIIKLPNNVPQNVADTFTALIPGFALVSLIWLIRVILKFDFNTWILNIFKPLVIAGDSLIAAIMINLFNKILWYVGIHGGAVIGAVTTPFLMMYATENAKAVQAGAKILPYITSSMFYDNIALWGNNMILPLLLIFACKNKGLKSLGKLALPISFFNIGEPVLFGLPVILNPFFLVPWLINSIIPTSIAWITLKLNLVTRPFISVPWTTPPIIGGFLSTGGDARAIVLTAIIFFVQLLIFYPFVKSFDNYTNKKESDKSL